MIEFETVRKQSDSEPLLSAPTGISPLLIVEDNPGDATLLINALKESGSRFEVRVASSGEVGLQILRQDRSVSGETLPVLIVLDLGLPGKSGREVLAELKEDSWLREIPVVVFTGSRSEEDIVACSGLNAEGFVIKPETWDQYLEAARYLRDFWLVEPALPPVWIRPEPLQKSGGKGRGLSGTLDAAEHALQQAQHHLEKATTALSQEDRGGWSTLMLLALNLRAAWEAIRLHWQRIVSADGLYRSVEAEAPWLSSRVTHLRRRLRSLEEATREVAERIERVSRQSPSEVPACRKEMDRMMGEIRGILSQENHLVRDSLIEPSALD